MTTNGHVATAAELFGKPSPRRFKTLDPLPVSGHVLRIRSLTERDKSDWEAETISKKGTGLRVNKLKDAHRRLFQLCVVDEAGNPFITDLQREEMRNWDSADTGYLYDEISAHCRINKDDVEELVKNSETTSVED